VVEFTAAIAAVNRRVVECHGRFDDLNLGGKQLGVTGIRRGRTWVRPNRSENMAKEAKGGSSKGGSKSGGGSKDDNKGGKGSTGGKK